MKKFFKQNCYAMIAFSLLLILWHIAAIMMNSPEVLPTPFAIVERLIKLWTTLYPAHFMPTIISIAVGLLISMTVGFLLAVLMHISRVIHTAVYPILVITQTVPFICVTPIFVLWFGYSLTLRLVVVTLSCFFVFTVNTYDGFQSVKREHRELLTTFGAGRIKSFLMLDIPYALPQFISALKISIPWAISGAAVAEWLGATSGLGYFSKRMMTSLDAANVLAPIVILTIVALICESIIKNIDKRKVAWRNEL